MKEINLSMEGFKENIIGLLMNAKASDMFEKQLPPPAKANFTKTYNNLMNSSLKPTKRSRQRSGDNFKRFDPDCQSAPSEDDSSSNEFNLSDDEIVEIKDKSSLIQKKRGRQTNSNPQTPQQEVKKPLPATMSTSPDSKKKGKNLDD